MHAKTPSSVVLLRILVCSAVGLIAIGLRSSGTHVTPLLGLLAYGTAVLGAAFLLAWAAEALQKDVSQGLALAVLAFIAVLPEYAVDLYFAWSAAKDPTYAQYAVANMTGSNRLLIGIGWSVVVLVGTYAARRDGKSRVEQTEVHIGTGGSVDLVVLTLATLWALFMPLSHTIAIWHGLGLLLLFGFYLYRVSGRPEEEPELTGVAHTIGELPTAKRRLVVGLILSFSALVLLCAAEPFAESLIASGRALGVDQFILVQWVAPLASEAPELLVAIIFALHGNAPAGLGALLSSKVNQWTLLVGTLPMVYSFGMGHVAALPLNDRQSGELLLTSAQSILGVAFLCNGTLHRWEAWALLILFLVQLPFPSTEVRHLISAVYLLLALVIFVRERSHILSHLRSAFGLKS